MKAGSMERESVLLSFLVQLDGIEGRLEQVKNVVFYLLFCVHMNQTAWSVKAHC
jgi:uncharacterized protein Smg (DUF494 family)